MSQRTRVQWLRIIELSYAIFALFALTQGPVIRMWRPSEALLESLPNPSIPHVHLATYLAVQLPAVVLWARRLDTAWFRERPNQVLVAFVVWLGMGVTWSTFARHSFPEFLALFITTIFGLYLAETFNARQIWFVIAGAMALGVGFSWMAIMRLWDGAVNFQEDYWIGIYYNRNSLAPVAATAILAALGVLVVNAKSMRLRALPTNIAAIIAAITLTVFAAIELFRSESQTSPAAMAIAAATCAIWLVVRVTTQRFAALSVVGKYSLPIVLVAVASVVFFAMRMEIGVGGVESQTTAFNQRSGLWALSWAGFLEKPWHGWGWMSAWHTPLFFLASKEPTWMAWGLEWSHNGYHDILLGGGVPAGVLFALYLVVASRPLSTQSPEVAAPKILVMSFVLAAATQESFFVGSHFLWALLVAMLTANSNRSRLADE